MAHFSLTIRWTASDNRTLISCKIGAQLIFLLTHKIVLIKTVLKFREIVRNFEYSEINVISFPPKKWIILHPKFYTEYKYSDHIQKNFHNF